MGWMRFEFGSVIRHLREKGVTTLSWDGEEIMVYPAVPVHPDIITSLRKGRAKPFTMSLKDL